MNPLYNTGLRLYALGARCAALRSPKVQKMIKGQGETLRNIKGWRTANGGARFDLWVHAASLGEFEQARPLIEKLKREHPEKRVLLTFFSPSGYEVRKHYPHADLVAYLPFDTPHRVSDFLKAAEPRMAIFVKYEFWGNYLSQLRRHGVATYIIDSIFRPSQRFFRPYGGMFRKMLRCFDHIYVQDDNSRILLAGIGIDNVTVAGDTRFDRVTDVMRTTVDFPAIEQWLGANRPPVLIAGSSWGPDEACYIPYLNSHPEVRAIIAPHEFDDARLRAIQASISAPSMLMSDAVKEGKIPDGVQAIIVDSFGKLSSIYRYGSVALIGGGFGTGIHNINEAAVYGMPVVFGPNHHKFKEAADLIACGGGFEYADADGLAKILDRFFAGSPAALAQAGQAAGSYISSHLGATDKIYSDLFNK